MTKKKEIKGESSTSYMDLGGQKIDIMSIRKDIENLGKTHMTWKDKKALENKKIVDLGGKPPKKQRTPLSVAKFSMKNQKEKEQKRQQEGLILGKYGGYRVGGGSEKQVERRRPEDSVLMSTGGHFRKGVLDVKHLLKPSTPKGGDDGLKIGNKGTKRNGGKKKHGKKKQGGRKRR